MVLLSLFKLKMSNVRKARREIAKEGNTDGLVAVQMPDGSMKHITREEWGEMSNGGVSNGDSEGTGE